MACETALSRKYTAYPEYVPSGVDSTPEMPSHWIAGKVKYVTDSLDKIRVPLSSEERGSRKGEYPYYGASGIIDYVDDYLFDEETILFGEDGANLIARSSPLAFLAKGKYWVNNHAHILRTKDGVNNFWVMSFENIDVRTVVSGSAQPKLTAEALGDLELVYPPTISEREQIANFLDHETAKIDTLIDKQQQLITLLKEKRQAVISHAVTKGLNPNAPMRDSGVEWLGVVPEHWEVTRAKFVSNIFVPQRNKPDLNDLTGIAWATMEDMKNHYINSTKQFVSFDASKVAGSKTLKAGSVIASCVGNFGVTAINKVDVIINQQLQAFVPTGIKSEYLREIVSISTVYFEFIGTAATLVYVNQQGFENLPVLVPSEGEQNDICAFVDKECDKFDKLMQLCETTTHLLKERRTALISAAVTGKIDVRNWIAPTTTNNKEVSA
jgi:type I restriction enzyme S subunit